VTFVDWDEIPKWKLINKALDLSFEEPLETYSSSKHLYADLGIPEGTKGTLPRTRGSARGSGGGGRGPRRDRSAQARRRS
jgi:hypothetical protein